MSTTPEQLRLAADILQNNWPWEILWAPNREWKDPHPMFGITHYIDQGIEVRRKPLSFPPKPDQFEWHNPDGLTAEQVGDGWRLAVVGEPVQNPDEANYWGSISKEWHQRAGHRGDTYNETVTYRVPLSTPYPDGSYVKDGKLVKPWVPKFKVGDRVRRHVGEELVVRKVLEYGLYNCRHIDDDLVEEIGEDNLSLIPWTLSRHLPNFRPLRDGEEWHRQDWTEEMLPEGWRPYLNGEILHHGGEFGTNGDWAKTSPNGTPVTKAAFHFYRTRRPLPEPEPKPVALGPEDWIKDGPWWVRSGEGDNCPSMVVSVNPHNIFYGRYGSNSHEQALNLQRSNNGITWTPCSKEATV